MLTFDKESFITYLAFSEHLDPLGKGYYIGYSQRVEEKHALQQDYLRKRIELKHEQAKNYQDHVEKVNTIAHLQESNHRMAGLLEQQ